MTDGYRFCAIRQFTRRKSAPAIAELEANVARLATLPAAPGIAPVAFSQAMHNCSKTVYKNCGAGLLQRTLHDQANRSIWGTIWRAQPLDFMTLERRMEAVEYWQRMLKAVRKGDERMAEKLFRGEVHTSRDHVAAVLSNIRNETAEPALMFRD